MIKISILLILGKLQEFGLKIVEFRGMIQVESVSETG